MRTLAALALAAVLAPAPSRGAALEAGPASGRIVVHAYKAGIFSGFAHDHHFEVTDWRATADVPEGDPARAALEVVLAAGSLRDRQASLSEADRRKVDAQAAGPKVLDAEHHPPAPPPAPAPASTPRPAGAAGRRGATAATERAS